MNRIFFPFFVACLVAACNREAIGMAGPSHNKATPSVKAQAPGSVSEVLVEVNGDTLTVAEARKQVETRLAAVRNRLQPAQLDTVRRRMLGTVIDQFVMRRLLMDEAERLGIEPTAEEEARAYEAIRSELPEGTTLEDTLRKSPMGEARMREEVIAGITVNKVLTHYVTNRLSIADEEIEAYFEANRDKLSLPETVQARHILLAVPENADADLRAAKRAKAEELRQALADGADFEALARAHSDCPSRARGGDLGTFPRGKMVPAFEEAAFALDPGAISKVVETPFGFHIIKVVAHHPAGPMPREQVAAILRQRRQQAILQEYINELKAKASIKYYGPPPESAPMPPPIQPPQKQP